MVSSREIIYIFDKRIEDRKEHHLSFEFIKEEIWTVIQRLNILLERINRYESEEKD